MQNFLERVQKYHVVAVVEAPAESLTHLPCARPSCGRPGMALIVHPKYPLPVRRSLAEPATIHLLPLHVLNLVASKLDAAKDLLIFEQVCTTAR